MNKNHIVNIFRVVTLSFIFSALIGYSFAAWTPAPSSPPSGNPEPPINTSAAAQIKTGNLGVNNLTALGIGILSTSGGAFVVGKDETGKVLFRVNGQGSIFSDALSAGGNLCSNTSGQIGNCDSGPGDNLGNHQATRALNMNDFPIIGGSSGLGLVNPSGGALLVGKTALGPTGKLLFKVDGTGTIMSDALTAGGELCSNKAGVIVNCPPGAGDNLGNHQATRALNMNGFPIIGGTGGLGVVSDSGSGLLVGKDTAGTVLFRVNGQGAIFSNTLTAGGNVCTGAAGILVNCPPVTGDNLGNHTATINLNMNTHAISGVTTLTASGLVSAGGLSTGAITATGLVSDNVRVNTLAGTAATVCHNVNGLLINCSSDVRLKKNIETISDTVDILGALKKLRGVFFHWNTSIEKVKDNGDQKELGMIAQEVEAVLPEVVHTDIDGYKSLDYQRLVGFLVEVNKKQQAEIELQQNRIDALERDVELLKSRM